MQRVDTDGETTLQFTVYQAERNKTENKHNGLTKITKKKECQLNKFSLCKARKTIKFVLSRTQQKNNIQITIENTMSHQLT